MKKYLFIIPIAMFFFMLYVIPAKASTIASNYGWYIEKHDGARYNWHFLLYTYTGWVDDTGNMFYMCKDVGSGLSNTYDDAMGAIQSYIDRLDYWLENRPLKANDYNGLGSAYQYVYTNSQLWIFNVPYRDLTGVNFDVLDEPEEDEGLAGWLFHMWEVVFDLFGWDDDYTEDLGDEVNSHSGGAHHGFQYVTPSPSPTPTPYSVVVEDQNGNTVYNITGFPQGDTNNTTNNYFGDDFDIFDVDVKLLPSGGVSNPKDGLNSVMDSNDDVLNDIDMDAVGQSMSVLPEDWFIMLGVLISMPFIAGIISKLLK